MFVEYFRVAFKNVTNRRMRSWLTILGIIVGVATIVALVSLSEGLQNAIAAQFESLGVKNIRVMPANLRGPPVGDVGLDINDVDVIESVKGVDYVNPLLFNVAEVEYDNKVRMLLANAEKPETSSKGFADLSIELEAGRFFSPSDSGVVLIGYDVAHDLYDRDVRIRNSLLIQHEKFKVIGIFEETGTDVDTQIYMVEDDARSLFNKPRIVNAITVAVLPGEDLDEVASRITYRLKIARGKEDFEVMTPAQILGQLDTILSIVQAILVAIAAVSLLVGSVGIMNAMFTAVLERTKEVGILKAIGAGNGDIFALFVIEAGFIGLVGGLLGCIVGLLVAKAVEYGAAVAGFGLLLIRINWNLMLFSLVFAFVIGIIAGFLPSLRAARLKPVDALRYE